MNTASVRRISVIGTGIAVLAVLAGCSSTSSESASDAAMSSPSVSAAEPPSQGESESVEGPSTVDMPESVRTVPSAAAAWTALMGPDGEYAAYAAYTAVIDTFGSVEPYASIRDAEQNHAESLARQLERLGVDVPENPYVGQVAPPVDLSTAAAAWAAGEVANVALYDELLAQVPDDAALTRVFTDLRRASEEVHLPAFQAAADHGGELTPEQMAELGMH